MVAWGASTGLVVQHQTVHAGAWAASMNSTGAGRTFASATVAAGPEVFLKAWVFLNSFASRVTFLRMRSSSGADIASAGVLPSGRMFTRAGPSAATVASQYAFPLKGWHELQLHANVQGAGSRIDVWLDGIPVQGLSTNAQLGNQPIGRVEIGEPAVNRTYSAAFDDVAADTAYIDDLGPTIPTGLHVTPLSGTDMELSWNASAQVDMAGYTVYRLDGPTWDKIGSSAANRFIDNGLAASTTYSYSVDSVDTSGAHSARAPSVSGRTRSAGAPPIAHVVIIDMENHSFDNVLGKFCADVASGAITGHQPCDGATTAVLSDGTTVPLTQAPDIVPGVDHSVVGQQTAIDGGAMDGFSRVVGCARSTAYACLSEYYPSQIPNLAALAKRYAVSDRTFEFSTSPSWVGHMVLASANQDGFQGDIPTPSTFTSQTGPGWGCNSYRDAQWWNGTAYIPVPSCIPDRLGAGPYRTSPVAYVPTIFDRLHAAGLSWKIYGGSGPTQGYSSGYGWSICPTFYECLGSAQKANWVPAQNVIGDASAAGLPNFSIVAPPSYVSEHNNYSMTLGDDWLGQVMGAIQSGPDWATTAVFITYDDCGCFYDHVAPPAGQGVRVPLVIVSPYVTPGATDSHPATYASLLAYAEHVFGLHPLATADKAAYAYGSVFDYTSPSVSGAATMVRRGIPARERTWLRKHQPVGKDPT